MSASDTLAAEGPGVDTWLPRSRDFTLAALAAGYPSIEGMATLCAAAPTDVPGLSPMLARFEQDPEALRSDYARCFDVGKGRVPLYETEYGRMRGLSKGKDLADIVGFYTAFGFELGEAGELADHLAVELEFYALLLYKQHRLADDPVGTEIVADARRKFLRDHLGGFVTALSAFPSIVADPVYGPLLAWCAGLVSAECGRELVSPAPLDFFDAGEAGTGIACGECVGIPGLDGKKSPL